MPSKWGIQYPFKAWQRKWSGTKISCTGKGMERWAIAPCWFNKKDFDICCIDGFRMFYINQTTTKMSSSKLFLIFWNMSIISGKKQLTNLNPKVWTCLNPNQQAKVIAWQPNHVNWYSELPKAIPSFTRPGFVVLHCSSRWYIYKSPHLGHAEIVGRVRKKNSSL